MIWLLLPASIIVGIALGCFLGWLTEVKYPR